MTINFADEVNADFEFDYEEVAENVIKETLLYEHFPYDIEVGISLVDEETIKKLNNDYRNIDKVTDVLSFPLIDYDSDEEDRYGFIQDELDYINPDNDEVMLGDIVICVPKVYSQAEEYKHSVKREYAFLIAHSMLHLLGYDHMDEGERSIMEFKQSEILENLNIRRVNHD